jgi:predicted GIY-YIG superfamily endonuclease
MSEEREQVEEEVEEELKEEVEEEKEEEKEEEEKKEEEKEGCANDFFVYLLQASDKKSTYVGATVNLNRRLRQHNKVIKGGAKATGAKVERGLTWARVAHVKGFPTWSSALQFEWRWKQLTRKTPKTCAPLQRRMMALSSLLRLERSTSKAIPFAAWPSQPQVALESEEAEYIFKAKQQNSKSF